ncbi:MAG TPA: hypothetical protein VFK05_10525 [Polyangiaceae bacterium]|nr:hypothetical protein [Polyangiaceae bacterium]
MPDSDHSAFSRGSPFARLAAFSLPWVTAALMLLGCKPKIGDDCTVSTNCSTTGDRLCDVTQPGGYCTVFNCEPGSCPDDSRCVNFGTTLSPIDGCATSQANSPYKRSFCMAHCSKDSDCRDGYRCLEPKDDCAPKEGEQPSCFNAVLAEHQSGQKVCAVPPHSAPVWDADAGGGSPGVCIGSDAGPTAGSSSSMGGSGGGAAEGGSAGTSEAGSAGESGSGGSVETGGSESGGTGGSESGGTGGSESGGTGGSESGGTGG